MKTTDLGFTVIRDGVARIEENMNNGDLNLALRRVVLLELNLAELKESLQKQIREQEAVGA